MAPPSKQAKSLIQIVGRAMTRPSDIGQIFQRTGISPRAYYCQTASSRPTPLVRRVLMSFQQIRQLSSWAEKQLAKANADLSDVIDQNNELRKIVARLTRENERLSLRLGAPLKSNLDAWDPCAGPGGFLRKVSGGKGGA